MSSRNIKASIRVLLADDQLPARLGLEALLSTYKDIEVVGAAADGREAMELADRLCPDLILMDGRMPVMDGVEATRQIKARHPNITVVMHSMYGSLEADAKSAGADVFLLKGCPPDHLVATVREAVARCQEQVEDRARFTEPHRKEK